MRRAALTLESFFREDCLTNEKQRQLKIDQSIVSDIRSETSDDEIDDSEIDDNEIDDSEMSNESYEISIESRQRIDCTIRRKDLDVETNLLSFEFSSANDL